MDFGESSVQITWKITGSTSAGSGNDREAQPGSQASNYNDWHVKCVS